MEGNQMMMREAMEKIRRELNDYCNDCTLLDRMTEDPPDYTCLRDSLIEIDRIVDAALSAPARQCDVGTAEEQERRYERFCDSHKWVDDEGANACLADCPLYNTLDCALHWAQMPYEAKEGAGK